MPDYVKCMQHLILNDYIYFKGGFSVEIRVELVTH